MLLPEPLQGKPTPGILGTIFLLKSIQQIEEP